MRSVKEIPETNEIYISFSLLSKYIITTVENEKLSIMIEELREEAIASDVQYKYQISQLKISHEKELINLQKQITHGNVSDSTPLDHCIERKKEVPEQSIQLEIKIVENLYFQELVKSLWHITWKTELVSSVLQGVPDFLNSFCNLFQACISLCDNFNEENAENFVNQFLPLVGLLVNISANVDGRNQLLQREIPINVLKLLKSVVTFESKLNSDNEQDHQYTTNTRNVQLQKYNSLKELILSLLSNIMIDHSGSLNLIQNGFFQLLTQIFKTEKNKSLKLILIRMTKQAVEVLPWIQKDEFEGKTLNPSEFTNIQLEVGEIVTILTKDKTFKMHGLELLTTLQKTMVEEE